MFFFTSVHPIFTSALYFLLFLFIFNLFAHLIFTHLSRKKNLNCKYWIAKRKIHLITHQYWKNINKWINCWRKRKGRSTHNTVNRKSKQNLPEVKAPIVALSFRPETQNNLKIYYASYFVKGKLHLYL